MSDSRGQTIALKINGEARRVPAGMTISGLLEHLGIEAGALAVERNRAIVPKANYEKTAVLENDEIEIVSFIGGG